MNWLDASEIAIDEGKYIARADWPEGVFVFLTKDVPGFEQFFVINTGNTVLPYPKLQPDRSADDWKVVTPDLGYAAPPFRTTGVNEMAHKVGD